MEPTLSSMDISRVMEYLPHRYPFLMIDRVLSIEPGNKVVALKNVSINEPYFSGHFPHHPVMPGVLIIEALAQAAAVLTFASEDHKADEKMVYYFVGIDNARFKKPVTAGDQLRLEVSLTRHARQLWKFHGKAYVEDTMAAEADLLCTIRLLADGKNTD
jgi:3-hydroxyacyl-[acyl-carrier-protein] dehydratase